MAKKELLFIVLALFLLLSVGIPSVQAAEGPLESALTIIYDIFGFLPEQITPSNISPGSQGDFYARFLLWMLVYAILYFAATHAFGSSAPRGVVITVPLVLAIISVILIPSNLIVVIISTYSFI